MIDLRETSGLPLTLDDTQPSLPLQLDGGLSHRDHGNGPFPHMMRIPMKPDQRGTRHE